jgi:DNA-binding response OmpR family regulator
MDVLVIEDNPMIVEALTLTLNMRWQGLKLFTASTGKQGIAVIEKEPLDLILLDLGLPDIDGLEVLKQIRLQHNTPLIIITIRDDEREIVRGLEFGADDYIVKPFREMELLARINALLRRHHIKDAENILTYKSWRLDRSQNTLAILDKTIRLTHTESVVVETLMAAKGDIVSLPDIANRVWGRYFEVSSDAIRVYIRRLRIKIESNPDHPKIIVTASGCGYKLNLT